MTTLHAGGKFGGDGYKVSGGLHGVGVSVVNALSTYAKAEVHRDGAVHMQEYSIGKKKAAVKKVGTTKMRGTVITFEPDESIFETTEFNFDKVVGHLRQQAYLVKGMRITVIDAREYTGKIKDDSFYIRDLKLEVPSMTFYFEGGLLSLVRFYNQHQRVLHKNIFYIEKEVDDVQVEVSLQYVDDISARLVAFANNTYNQEGGMHVTGFKTALTRTINNYSRNAKSGKDEETFTGDDVLEGLTCVVSVKLPEIQFEGQTKAKLGSVEARGAVDQVFSEAFAMFLEENPDDARQIIGKASLAMKARKAAKAAKDSVLRKGALEGMTLPGKLADCSTRKAEDSEIWFVEGDSAGGSSKQARDRRTQAILPLRGKILNVERARLDRMLGSDAIKSIVIALGAGVGDTFNIEKLRYHKVIIAPDADIDGAHIATLLLTLFYRYFKELIEAGFIYIADPPLYKIQIGKEVFHARTDAEKDAILKEHKIEVAEGDEDSEISEDEGEIEEEVKVKGKKKAKVQRYKGFGEMNPDELWDTTMDPENRLLKQVTIEDAAEADMVFDTLMGTDVSSRKSFIESNAKMATLDI